MEPDRAKLRLIRTGAPAGLRTLAAVLRLCIPRVVNGPVAQLGARLNGIQEVTGSNPVRSTNSFFSRETEPK